MNPCEDSPEGAVPLHHNVKQHNHYQSQGVSPYQSPFGERVGGIPDRLEQDIVHLCRKEPVVWVFLALLFLFILRCSPPQEFGGIHRCTPVFRLAGWGGVICDGADQRWIGRGARKARLLKREEECDWARIARSGMV